MPVGRVELTSGMLLGVREDVLLSDEVSAAGGNNDGTLGMATSLPWVAFPFRETGAFLGTCLFGDFDAGFCTMMSGGFCEADTVLETVLVTVLDGRVVTMLRKMLVVVLGAVANETLGFEGRLTCSKQSLKGEVRSFTTGFITLGTSERGMDTSLGELMISCFPSLDGLGETLTEFAKVSPEL